ncbi:hypothetical protein C5167_032829 [Papaver somniferum]|uniref:Glutamine amidotransferase type-2 domain-containing protein n=1 Tax=Papaver somniferum TaxID=3469 RepID=A0A4Y7K9Z0_PAPSO|nr:hypothetical protein C5167_032829 [Papaver somniferum]
MITDELEGFKIFIYDNLIFCHRSYHIPDVLPISSFDTMSAEEETSKKKGRKETFQNPESSNSPEDPASGDQPLYNEDTSIIITVNGEIYNHEELRAKLKNHKFRSGSDRELSENAYNGFSSIKATTDILGLKGESSQWINVKFKHPHQSADDWSAVFFPAIFKISFMLDCIVLNMQGESSQWINVKFKQPHPTADDWIAVFSPANFNAPTYVPTMGVPAFLSLLLVSAPIKLKLQPNFKSYKMIFPC